jgi:ribonuclease T2
MKPRFMVLGLCLCLFWQSWAWAGDLCVLPDKPETAYDIKPSNDKLRPNPKAATDYYKLAISWAPSHCEKQQKKVDQLLKEGKQQEANQVKQQHGLQCFSGNNFKWVLHGLWAQSCQGRSLADCRDWRDVSKHPRYCEGDLPQLPYSTLKPYLCMSPGAKLLQGEWEKHGACDFKTAEDYFKQSQLVFNSIKMPDVPPKTRGLIHQVKALNPALKNKYILFNGRNELYICYNNQSQPISCPPKE